VAKTVIVSKAKKTFFQGGEETYVLRGVDFSADSGELVMIVGPSGSGKTTLLSVIAGTLRCDSGSINIFGETLSNLPEDKVTAFRCSSVGFIFQQFHLIPTLTCAENVSIPLLLNGWKRKPALEQAKAMLAEVGLAEKINFPPKKLSGGQQQRVAIARALVHNPKLIICDEPTSALDADTGSKIMEMIRAHAKASDRTVIVVTHDSRIFRFADRMVEMSDGQISQMVSHV
jgi:putative ABC transport system ATP-binding protein